MPFAALACPLPLTGAGLESVCVTCGLAAGGATAGIGVSFMGESGGGGMSVPSVREKETGVRAGRVNRPLGLPFVGIVSNVLPSTTRMCEAVEMGW